MGAYSSQIYRKYQIFSRRLRRQIRRSPQIEANDDDPGRFSRSPRLWRVEPPIRDRYILSKNESEGISYFSNFIRRMPVTVKSLIKENYFVFFLCLAALAGPALSSLFDGSEKQFPDAASYLGIAKGDYDQTMVRRYRVIIPLLARALDTISGGSFEHLRPTYYTGEFSIRFCFYLVNLFLMAIFCSLTFRYCRAYGQSETFALVGTVAVITSRYTIYFSALPIIDSLISVAVALVLLGIKTGNKKMHVLAIFLGPLARESFIFFAPLIVFFSGIPALKQVLYFGLSGLIAWSVRFLLDHYYPPTNMSWLEADARHLSNIQTYLPMLFSWYGVYKILINMGLWLVLPVMALFIKRDFLKDVFTGQVVCLVIFFISIVFQMLLSGSMERMFYPALMVFAVVVGAATYTIVSRLHPATKEHL